MTGDENRDFYDAMLDKMLADGDADLKTALRDINVVAGLAATAAPTESFGDATTGISVLVVDDHPLWREGIGRELAEHGFQVAAAGDAESAVRIARTVHPDVVMMDLNLGGLSGVDATARITAEVPGTPVLALSASGEHDDVLQAVKAGAVGYVVKSVSLAELVEALTHAVEGRVVCTAGLAGLILGEYRRMSATDDSAGAPRLTERETEVLRLVAKGLTRRQIANRLVIAHRTIENHVQATMRKLQDHNQIETARYAIELGSDELRRD